MPSGKRAPRSSNNKNEVAPETSSERESQPQQPARCPVAGLGASAGGLEAFTELLEHLPRETGAAVVFVQHLDPHRSSILKELLARTSPLPVLQAGDGMHLERNHVYVIPPNASMTITDDTLRIRPRREGSVHMPVDDFFRSLAEERGAAAIGVVLSGTGSDGTLGLKSIKAAGGIALAQQPESARYDGMPRSAMNSGVVDSVLPPPGLARELERLCQHPYVRESPPEAPEPVSDDEQVFEEIFAMLRSTTGVDFRHYKPGTIRRRTQRRMALLRLESPQEYLRHLREHRGELDHLFQDILINVTSFFREPGTFEAITAQVLPALFKERKPDDPVRVWVPGCATGEECYSIAICLLEYMREFKIELPIQIFGTDLSESALTRARVGVYPESIAADVSPERLRRFFVRVNGNYQIARAVRDVCVFARQNMTKDPPFSNLDLVLCRNVMIYLGPVLQTSALRLFHYALKAKGFLVLGLSENVGSGGTDLFAAVGERQRIYTPKPTTPIFVREIGSYQEVHHSRTSERHVIGAIPERQSRVDQVLLDQYAPPAVVVDHDLRVLQFRGDTSAFLAHNPGEASLSLLKMSRGGIGPEIRKLVRQAEQKNAAVHGEVLPMSEELGRIGVSVHPLGAPGDEAQFLVVFERHDKPAPAPQSGKATRGKTALLAQHQYELERELSGTKQYLQTLIEEHEAATEELKSAHEEVQSANEELQSTNEELLTAKEELQSTNEELTTVNEEMQSRNSELQLVNDDLTNLLSSVNIPIVMLDNEYRIRRFTPQAEKILNLLPSDVGRSISDFRLKINVPDLLGACHEVIETLASKEREVQDSESRTYSMWIRPYRTADNHIDGVVLSLFDITERKQATEARYRRMFEAARDGIIIIHAENGEILDFNPIITKRFGYTRPILLGQRLWDTDLFRTASMDASILSEVQNEDSVQRSIPLLTAAGEPVDVEVAANLYTEGERRVVQFNIRDVSARKRVEEKLRRADDEIRQSQKMEAVGRLAGGVAHDFNNLLTAVLGYSDFLRQTLEEDHPGRRLLDQITKAGERAVILTKQLLAFGRKHIVHRTVLNPNEVLEEIRQLLSVMTRENVELNILQHPGVGNVVADRSQLEQVVLNLALNARDSMPNGGRITIEAGNLDLDDGFSELHPTIPAGRYVVISVKDTGTGMTEETQSHIFEPFYTTKPSGSGVGLGLSTVYAIVTQNGGHIRATSELGVGSNFMVYLPRVQEDVTGTGETVHLLTPSGSETILLVEDEPPVRQITCMFLESLGYRVLEAACGPDALRLSREYQGRIDLLLTDVVMPQMSGREVAFQLSNERPGMRVLYMSGHTENVISHHGVLTEGVAFLQKPFTQHALAAKVRESLDRGK